MQMTSTIFPEKKKKTTTIECHLIQFCFALQGLDKSLYQVVFFFLHKNILWVLISSALSSHF